MLFGVPWVRSTFELHESLAMDEIQFQAQGEVCADRLLKAQCPSPDQCIGRIPLEHRC